MKKQISPKIVSLVFSVLVICFAVGFYTLAVWTEPTATPPGDNVAAPLNVSNIGQTKIGGLALNTGPDGVISSDGAANGLLVYEGNVGIGTTTPSSGTGGQLRLDVEGPVGATKYCDENGNNCKAITELLPTCSEDDYLQFKGGVWVCSSGPQPDYAIDSLRRCYSSYGGCSQNTGDWYSLITNNLVLSGTNKTNITYSTVQGNWIPIDTGTTDLKENVTGELNQGGKDPRSGYYVNYRIYRDTEVRIQSKTWANHGQVKLNRTDRFKRESQSIILINGSPQTINIGDSYEIQRLTWNPGDHGQGLSYLKIINTDPGFFDVEVFVWEYDEQYDSAHAKIDSYIERY